MGTAVLGSMIVAIVQWIKTTVYLIKISLAEKGNYFGTPIFEFLDFGFKGVNIVLMYINKNAYIMCAVHGTDFYNSAKQALSLVMKNITLALVTHWVSL